MNIIYFHGFGSSGQSTTPKKLQKFFPKDNVIAPDIPLNPVVALQELKKLVSNYKPEETVVVGTSMGGFFAQMMDGYDRVLVNPAFHVSDIIRKDIGQTKTWFSKRKDNSPSYYITPRLVDEFVSVEKHQFENIDKKSYIIGFFGDKDEVTNCREEFLKYYDRDVSFHGGHRITDEFSKDYLFPLLQVIRDIKENNIELFDIENFKSLKGDKKYQYLKDNIESSLILGNFKDINEALSLIDLEEINIYDLDNILINTNSFKDRLPAREMINVLD